MRPLNANEIDRLSRLLAKAVDFSQLERMVFLATGDRLFVEYVGPGLPLRPTIEKLIEALERDAVTERLAAVVYREKPFQTELRGFLLQLYPQIAPAAQAPTPSFVVQDAGQRRPDLADGGPGLQRVVKPALKQIDLRLWLDRADAISRQVSRIEADNAPLGTGFLVGSGLVLTNWHVIDEARKRGALARLGCRFDFNRLADGGVEAGTLVPVTGVLDERPCSPAELTATPDVPPPEADELDYALLELSEATKTRGFVALKPAPPIAKDDPLIIVQHPQGDSLKFALDTAAVTGFVHQDLRLRYHTNTLPGSSGSPCFSMELDLVALHHLGDPARGPALYNQGVPIDRVRASLVARGQGNRLGL